MPQAPMDRGAGPARRPPGQREALASLLLARCDGCLPARRPAGARQRSAARGGYERVDRLAPGLAHGVDDARACICWKAATACEALAVRERGRALAARSRRRAVAPQRDLQSGQAGHRSQRRRLAGALLDEGEALAPRLRERRMEQKFVAARFYVQWLRGESAAALDGDAAARHRRRAHGGPLERIGYRTLVVDCYLLERRPGARAPRCSPRRRRSATCRTPAARATYYAPQQAVKQARLALAEGRPRDALAALPQETALSVMADRFGRSWIGCAAGAGARRRRAAARYVESVDIDADVDNGTRALWLEQRLAFDAARGHGDSTALQRAEELLGQGRSSGDGRRAPAASRRPQRVSPLAR